MVRRAALVALALLPALLAGVENANVADPKDAPTFREKDPFTARITVRNPHDRAVRVGHMDSTCTCVKRVLRDSFILPNATTVLDITVDNRNRSGLQAQNVSVYLSDPDLEPIEVWMHWKVQPHVAVDGLPHDQQDTRARPAKKAWQDVYQFTQALRPDELHRLEKRIRLESPAPETPEGGFQILGVDYDGPLWRFAPVRQDDGSWLITATAKDAQASVPERVYNETAVVRTNHPDKARIELTFKVMVDKNAHEKTFDPNAMPPPIPGPPGPRP